MKLNGPVLVLRVAFLLGLLAVNLSAQSIRKPRFGNPFSGPLPEWPVKNLKVETGPSPLSVDPAHYHLELETEGIRVLRLTLEPDGVSPLHDDRDALIVCLTECHVRLTTPDGKFTDVHMEAGATRLLGGGVRSNTNLVSQPVELLFIERKPIPESAPENSK
jgi:hypothetical protein